MLHSVTVKTPAKLNLALDITGLMENGYHAMDMVMQAISLYETVTVSRSRFLQVRLPGSRVPADKHNTAYKAALAFFHETGLLAGADITIHKRTPVRAGMGGGSADAAAVLVGLNVLYGARMSLQELCALGATIGADVPFAVLGGTARVGGVGDVLTSIAPCPPCWFTVCMPGIGVSTPAAFARFDALGTQHHPNVAALQRAIENGDLAQACQFMGNALEDSSSVRETNEKICATLRQNGALAALMTGSGAALFGVFADEAAAQAAQAALPQDLSSWVVQPVARGAHVVKTV